MNAYSVTTVDGFIIGSFTAESKQHAVEQASQESFYKRLCEQFGETQELVATKN